MRRRKSCAWRNSLTVLGCAPAPIPSARLRPGIRHRLPPCFNGGASLLAGASPSSALPRSAAVPPCENLGGGSHDPRQEIGKRTHAMQIELTPAFRAACPDGVFGALIAHG